MLKNKKILTILLAIVMVLAIPTIANAAEEDYTKTIMGNDGSITLNLTGLNNLDTTKQHEFALVVSGGINDATWHLMTDKTETTATIELSSSTSDILSVLKAGNKGYLYIREKDNTAGYVLENKEIDLTLPYLNAVNVAGNVNDGYTVNTLYGYDNNGLQFCWEKITDETVIQKYINYKNNGTKIQASELKQEQPTAGFSSNWGFVASYGNSCTIYKYDLPTDGLYYLWIKSSNENCKTIYGYALHDGLPEAKTVAQYIGEQDVPVETIELNYPTMTLEPGKSLNLVPTIKPENATNKNVTYVSSNAEVATVDATGKVTAIKAGTATITVTTAEGEKKATCIVTVTEQSNEEWTDFSNAKFIAKANSYKVLTINLENITLDKNNLYYMYISKNNKEQPVVDYEKCARILEDDEGKLLATFYNDYSRTILEEAGQNYIYVIGRNSEGAEKILVNAKKMDYPVLPGLGKIFDIYLYDSTNSYFHNYIGISSTRTITYKIGKVTSNDVLKSLKNDSTDVSFANLLDYAKNATPLKTGTMKPEDLKYNIAKDITIEKEAYYFVYMIADTENGKYNYIEDVAIYQENNDENGNALVHFTFADIEIDEPEKEPVKDPVKDNTNAPVKLPNTGNTVFVVVGIVTLAVLSTIGFIKYKKFSKIV